jgi:molecular chaperone DnaK
MAVDNKTLGRFELVGIQPAPRGIPQIEVTFDIDANGIVSVSAKDMATGKAQSIQITASSGLTQDEIERLVKDAELHASEDQRKKELVQARNAADAQVYAVEKALSDLGSNLDSSSRGQAEAAVRELKNAMQAEDASRIRQLTEQLTQIAHTMTQAAYNRNNPGTGAGPNTGAASNATGRSAQDDDVVDADFEEVA